MCEPDRLERLYFVNGNVLQTFQVVKRTAKQIQASQVNVYGGAEHVDTYVNRFFADEGKLCSTPEEAWAKEAERLRSEIGYTTQKIQRLRSSLGTAERNAK